MATAKDFVDAWSAANPNLELVDVKFYYDHFPVNRSRLWSQACVVVSGDLKDIPIAEWPAPPQRISFSDTVKQ